METALMQAQNYFNQLSSYTSIVSSMSTKEVYETLMGFGEGAAISREENASVSGGVGATATRYHDVFEADGSLNTEDTHAISSLLTDFNFRIGYGCSMSVPTKEKIAEHFGDMAKRLDEAHSNGKFTEEEYEGLNKMLMEQMEKATVDSERNTARYALAKERGNLSPEAAKEVMLKEQSMTSEEYMAEWNKKIDKYVEQHCKIDRELLLQMFNNVRYGVLNLFKTK